MNVYLLFYSSLVDDDELYGIYSSYQKAENAIPPHEDTDYYDIFQTELDKPFTWDKTNEEF